MPNLKGVLPDRAVQVIQEISGKLETLKTQFTALSSSPILLKPEAEKRYGPATMVKNLQVSGSNPLNLTGLIGQPGELNGITVTATVRNAAGSGTSTFEFVNGILQKYTP